MTNTQLRDALDASEDAIRRCDDLEDVLNAISQAAALAALSLRGIKQDLLTVSVHLIDGELR